MKQIGNNKNVFFSMCVIIFSDRNTDSKVSSNKFLDLDTHSGGTLERPLN